MIERRPGLEVALAQVAFSEPAGLRKAARYALGYGGAVIAVVGLLVLGSTLRQRVSAAHD